jgi:hypothetical protein
MVERTHWNVDRGENKPSIRYQWITHMLNGEIKRALPGEQGRQQEIRQESNVTTHTLRGIVSMRQSAQNKGLTHNLKGGKDRDNVSERICTNQS